MNFGKIGLGTFPFSGVFGAMPQSDINAVVSRFVELGGRYIETAPAYPRTYDLGAAIRPFRSGNLVVASKCVTGPDRNGNNIRSGKREHIRFQVEGELTRLGVDCLDLLQSHTTPEDVPIENFLDTIDELISEGKIRWFGVSNVNIEQLEQLNARGTVSWVQNRLSPIHEIHCRPIQEYCVDNGVLINSFQSIERGQLMPHSTFDREILPGDLRSKKPEYVGDANAIVRKWFHDLSVEQAEDYGVSADQLAIAWCLSQPGVSMSVIGATSPSQLNPFMKLKAPIDERVVQFMDEKILELRRLVRSDYGLSLEEFRGVAS